VLSELLWLVLLRGWGCKGLPGLKMGFSGSEERVREGRRGGSDRVAHDILLFILGLLIIFVEQCSSNFSSNCA
jgi:hypothetical protein